MEVLSIPACARDQKSFELLSFWMTWHNFSTMIRLPSVVLDTYAMNLTM